jgi:hypothetical protein
MESRLLSEEARFLLREQMKHAVSVYTLDGRMAGFLGIPEITATDKIENSLFRRVLFSLVGWAKSFFIGKKPRLNIF